MDIKVNNMNNETPDLTELNDTLCYLYDLYTEYEEVNKQILKNDPDNEVYKAFIDTLPKKKEKILSLIEKINNIQLETDDE